MLKCCNGETFICHNKYNITKIQYTFQVKMFSDMAVVFQRYSLFISQKRLKTL